MDDIEMLEEDFEISKSSGHALENNLGECLAPGPLVEERNV